MATKSPSAATAEAVAATKAAPAAAMSIVDVNRPSVDRGATMLFLRDRHAYFVRQVAESGKECVVIRARNVDGKFETAPGAGEVTLKHRYGAWWAVTTDANGDVDYVRLPGTMYFGGMEEFTDYSSF